MVVAQAGKLAERLAEALRAWEEMPTGADWYPMRRRAEERYKVLLALSRAAVVAGQVRGPTAPRTAAGWKRAANRAGAR